MLPVSNPNQSNARGRCGSPQGGQCVLKILRPRRLETHAFTRPGMDERQPAGVQHLARRRVVGQFRQALVLPVPVGRVAYEREAEELEVNPDLASTSVAPRSRSST